MKKTVLFSILLTLSIGLLAQKKEMPAQVNEAFQKMYPNATEVKHKKQKSSYKIKFNNQGDKSTSIFNMEGNWEKTEILLMKERIPETIRQSIVKKYPKGSFNSAKLTETSEGKHYYEVSVDTDKFTYNLELDKSGKIIKTDKIAKESPKPAQSNNGGGGSDGGGDGE